MIVCRSEGKRQEEGVVKLSVTCGTAAPLEHFCLYIHYMCSIASTHRQPQPISWSFVVNIYFLDCYDLWLQSHISVSQNLETQWSIRVKLHIKLSKLAFILPMILMITSNQFQLWRYNQNFFLVSWTFDHAGHVISSWRYPATIPTRVSGDGRPP